MFSMNTGQACSHQPHVVHAHTVSGLSTFPTIGGISHASPAGVRPSAIASSFSQIQCLRSWFTALCASGLPVMYVGQCVWQRPHSVHEYTSSTFFQCRSETLCAPNSSFSRFGVGSFPV